MGDEGPPRKRSFHPLVVAPFLGDTTAVAAIVEGLVHFPPGSLGSAETVRGARTESRPADPTWSSLVQVNGGLRSAVRAAPQALATEGAIAPRGQARCDKHPRPLPERPRKEVDDKDTVGGVAYLLNNWDIGPCSPPCWSVFKWRI